MNLRTMAACVALAMTTAACNGNGERNFQGWIEADFIFVSPDEPGRIVKLEVREGDQIRAGAPLFALDDDLQRADLNQNNATLANAKQTYDRAVQLGKTGAGTQAALDAATSSLRVAEARVVTSQTRLSRRSASAPVTGTIQQIYFREGEMVGAQRPVVSILPPGNLKVRFYVPESELPKVALGDTVRILCDGCAQDLTAKVSFMSTTAEYTPPVIYSQDERSKLVFLIQAIPSTPARLRVGQPVSISLERKTAAGGGKS